MLKSFLPMPFPELILASNSPRRKKLLSLAGKTFRVQPANVNEDIREGEDASDYVARLATEKAALAAEDAAGVDVLVLAADTTVAQDGIILGKPVDAADAKRVLQELRGRTHLALTAITLLRVADGAKLTDLAITEVPMRNYSDAEIDAYVASGDPLDKAGSYAIQNTEFHPVKNMSGCYANVVGLPLCHLQRTLARWDLYFDVDLPAACQEYLGYDCPVTKKILNWEL